MTGRAVPTAAGAVTVRELQRGDAARWAALREANRGRLVPWEALPPGARIPPQTPALYRRLLRALRREGSRGFAVCVDGVVHGQVLLTPLRTPARSASVGYWVDAAVEGCGVTTAGLALVLDAAVPLLGLHRVEADVQPANLASQRVLEKLGFSREGVRRRLLHVAGQWRDHELWAVTAEELPPGGLARSLTAG